MMVIWNKLKYLNTILKDLNAHMASYAHKLNQERQQLKTVQSHIATHLFFQSLINQEKAILEKIQK